MAGTYKTSGRERLLSFLASHPDTPYTVDELAVSLNSDAAHPDAPMRSGKSSLYRQLSELVADGTVRCDREERGDDRRTAASVYRYVAGNDCAHHIHLQCVGCGKLIHLDCHIATDLLAHIRTDHRFRIDAGRSVLYGVCESCGG